jgi:ubiquinone/menaquinone biosynthesis C-methylase UbiE
MAEAQEEQRKAVIRDTFDAVSAGYDGTALRFFPESAKQLAVSLNLRGDEEVLDVATGTGHAALAIAKLLPRGRVTGVDMSPGMLEKARQKAAADGAANVRFIQMDMQDLAFPSGAFDAAVCAFGIFFVDEMESQLARIAATVKPGGLVAISGFCESYFLPQRELMVQRLQTYGAQMPLQNWKRIAHEAGCRELFARAGLDDVRVEQRNVGYYLDGADEWWDVIWNAGYRRLVNQLPPPDLERFKKEHLQEIDALRTSEGLWLDVGVLFTIGRVP